MNQMIFKLQPAERTNQLGSTFYVIEAFPYPNFVTDENGELRSFDTYEKAKREAQECQDGHVISL